MHIDKKKIAIISPEFRPYTNWGGIATFNENLAYLLRDLGNEIDVISFNPHGNHEVRQLSSGITHHSITFKTNFKAINFAYYKFLKPTLSLLLFKFPNLIFFLEWNFFSFMYFFKIHTNKKFVTIHSPSYFSPSLFIKLYFKSITLITHVQGPEEDLMNYTTKNLDKLFKAKIEKWFVRHLSNIVIVCNKTLKKKIKAKSKVLYIPNFIYSRSKIEQTPKNTKTDTNNIVYWGRIEHRKGVEPLIKAFITLKKRNRKLKLWLIGDSYPALKYKNNFVTLEEFSHKLQIPTEISNDIFHIPRIDNPITLKTVVQKINGLCVFPSLHEPFGFVYIESMSMGMVTIASSSGEGKKIISKNIDGFVSEPTAESLAKSIVTIQNLKVNQLNSITKNAIQKVNDNYSSSSISSQYKSLYKII